MHLQVGLQRRRQTLWRYRTLWIDLVVGKKFFREDFCCSSALKPHITCWFISYPSKYKLLSKWQACLKPLSLRPQLVGFKISQRRTGMRPSAGGVFVTRWNEPVNFIHIFEERIKMVAETAVRVAAKRSGIFPQPEADLAVCQKQVCFLSLFNMPKAPRSLCPAILLVLLQNHILACHFFLSVIILSFTWAGAFRGFLPAGHNSVLYWNYCKNVWMLGVSINLIVLWRILKADDS